MSQATIYWHQNAVRLIDQTLLPNTVKYLTCKNVQTLWEAIKTLRVRGAPAIGIAAGFGVLLGVQPFKGNDRPAFEELVFKTCDYIGSSRPTAVNLFNVLAQMKEVLKTHPDASVSELKVYLKQRALALYEEDRQVCRAMGRYGASLVVNAGTYMTICNAGALATVDFGTALGVFYSAKDSGKHFKVFALETRPLLQGARLTAWELLRAQIDTTLICDNMAASVMAKGNIKGIFAGADRIALNGDTANKIGTYSLAVLAKYHRIPFYIVAPLSTFDRKTKTGKGIPIEERGSEEVKHFGSTPTAPKQVKVFNPAFDVTPADLIAGIVTEKGIIRKPYTKNIKKILSS